MFVAAALLVSGCSEAEGLRLMLSCFTRDVSWSHACQRNNHHTISTSVLVLATCYDHKENRFSEGNLIYLFVMFPDKVSQLFEVGSAFFNLTAAQFTFDEGVTAVFQM